MISTSDPYFIKYNITGIEKQGVTNVYTERNIWNYISMSFASRDDANFHSNWPFIENCLSRLDL